MAILAIVLWIIIVKGTLMAILAIVSSIIIVIFITTTTTIVFIEITVLVMRETVALKRVIILLPVSHKMEV